MRLFLHIVAILAWAFITATAAALLIKDAALSTLASVLIGYIGGMVGTAHYLNGLLNA